jgi:sensor domain CHASE-containing protein
MTLLRKTALIIAVTLAAMAVILYGLARLVVLDSFCELDARHVEDRTASALSAIQSELEDLKSTSYDWAGWDATYAFIEDGNQAYIEENITDNAIGNLRLNLMVFVHASGRVVAAKGFDLDAGQDAPAPQSLLDLLAADPFLLEHEDVDSRIAGLVMLPEAPLLVASCPIQTSAGEGPIRGTFLIGRLLNATALGELGRLASLPLSLHRLDGSGADGEIQAALEGQDSLSPVVTRILGRQSMAGYGLAYDLQGRPAFVLRAELRRDIYLRGEAAIAYFVVFMVGAGLVVGVLIVLLLRYQVLSGLIKLERNVSTIGQSKSLSVRLDAQPSPELQRLALAINEMLEAIEKTEMERAHEERLKGVLEMAGAACHELNQPMQAISGYCEMLIHQVGADQALFERLRIIQSQIERMTLSTRKLQRISRYMTRDYIEGVRIVDLDKATGDFPAM